MTFRPSSPRAKPRWLTLFVLVLTLTVSGATIVLAHGAEDIPSNYIGGVVHDEHGANDVPGQVDVTQMGRDTAANPNIRVFWSWDSVTAWTGSGQTGDACALFDTEDADAFINYVVCARVQNTNAGALVQVLPASANHPVYIFDCSNKKNDRCTSPAPRSYAAGQVTAGPLGGTLSQTGAGDLVSEMDPFDGDALNGPGESHPHDTTIDILIDGEGTDSLVPAGARLANVCSYPSAGNGGNNNPFDCVVTPGVQYGTLRVTKVLPNDNGSTAVPSSFSFTVDGGSAIAFEADGSNDIVVTVGNHSVVEVGVPITGFATTYANSVNSNTNCTSLAVTVGATTTCTVTNNDRAGTLIVKKLVINDNGGTSQATAFTFQVNNATAVTFLQDPNDTDTKKGQNTLTVNAGTYTVTEPAVAGYSTSYSNCTGVVIANGGTATCTITNNDNVATPGISTVMKWTLNDRSVMTGWLPGGGASTVTFSLYKDAGASVSCEPGTFVTSFVANVNDANGSAATTTGYTTEVAGTYHWIAAFSGNSFNGPISSNCADETTTLP